MKKSIILTTSLLLLCLWPSQSRADYCDQIESEINSSAYSNAYCKLRLHKNRNMNDKVFRALSDQLGYSKELIEKVLTEGDLSCGNEEFKKLCEEEGSTLTDLSNVKARFQKAYRKEKALQLAQRKMEIQLESSEVYWDGRLAELGKVPFDLMTDLNLLKVSLFGSRAKWTYDVFKFPTKEEGAGVTEDLGDILPDEVVNEIEDIIQEQEAAGDPGLDIGKEVVDCAPNQGSADAYPSCGNSILDVLVGESCDDGNRNAGDGCSASCAIEATGANEMCQDPEAITFGTLDDLPEEGAENDSQNGDICPPGMHPVTEPEISGNDTNQKEYPQEEGYPGPLVGGTFKKFPESSRPACPVGQSEIKVDLINGQQESACVPTQLCGDFNQTRDFLFGADWETNPEKWDNAKSVEALFCVDVVPWNRPLTPYSRTEGCIDCHIRAMADKIEEALMTNVSPLENTMNAFSISNRWGPTFSFDLNTMLKSKIALRDIKNDYKKDSKGAKEQAEEATREKTPGQTAADSSESASEQLSRQQESQQQIQDAQEEALRVYADSSDSISDLEFSNRVLPLLDQMRSLFEGIQVSYGGIAQSAKKLAEKEMCSF